jgi:Flp pilus assembly protein TadG
MTCRCQAPAVFHSCNSPDLPLTQPLEQADEQLGYSSGWFIFREGEAMVCRPSRGSISHRRKGAVLWFGMAMMAVLCGFASFGVDFGRAQAAKTSLRRAADVAARAAASKLDQTTTVVRNEAITWAGYNRADGHSVVLQSGDIDIGNWANGTFTVVSGTTTANAVRVTAQLSSARGTAVPLLFARVLGKSSSEITAVAIASYHPTGYGVVGLNYIAMTGNATTSYWSATGATSSQYGNIASNGSITLGGNSYINGNASPGVGKSIDNPGKVSGSTASLTTPLSYPNGDPGNAATNNNDASIDAYGPYMDWSRMDYTESNNRDCTFAPGVYYFHNFTMASKSNLTINGPVTIYCTGSISLSGTATTTGAKPGDLKIVMCPDSSGNPPGSVSIGSSSDLYANIYAPQSDITLSGSGDIYGSVVGKSISMTGTTSIHYDLSLPGASTISLVK